MFQWVVCHLFWFTYLLLMLAILFYDLTKYLISQWGHQDELLHLVSYSTFILQVLVVPMSCLIARIRSVLFYQHAHFTQCLPTINCTLVFRRAVFLQSPACAALSCSKFALFLSWPVVNGVIRVTYDYWARFAAVDEDTGIEKGTVSYADMVYGEISHWAAVIGYLKYGTFCYLIYILRKSLQWELNVVLRFLLSRSSTGNVDSCRNRISDVYAHFRVLRDLVGLWMAFTMVVATWGITAHVTWNYAIFTRCHLSPEGRKHVMYLNGLIWSQKVMFFVLPYIAVGGLNLQYVWQHFRYDVIRLRRMVWDKDFWGPVIQFTKDINFSGLALKPTILFSAVGLFLGLKIRSTNQNVDFWNGPYNIEHTNWGYCVNTTSL